MDTELLKELSDIFTVRHMLQLAAIIVITAFLQFVAKYAIRAIVHSTVRGSEIGARHEEKQRKDTLISIIYTTALIALWVGAFLMALSVYDVNVGPLLAGAGIAGVALGFGAQTMVKDFLAGIFIIGENQYRIGDVISVNKDVSGTVESLSLRMTSLRDLDGRVHYIPNGSIQIATNMTMEYANVELDIGVAYDTNVDHVEKVIEKTGLTMQKDDKWSESILEAPYMLRVESFGESALILKILCKTQPGEQWSVKGEFLRRLKKAFDNEDIEIPFPQIVVHQPKPANKSAK